MQHRETDALDDRMELAAPVVIPNLFDGYLTEEQYAAQRGVSLRTCQRDRQLRQSPPYTVIGKKVLYRRESVRQWLLDQERQVERKASAPRAGGRK